MMVVVEAVGVGWQDCVLLVGDLHARIFCGEWKENEEFLIRCSN